MNEKENKNIDKDKELKEEKESSELSDKDNKEKKVTKKESLKEKSSDIGKTYWFDNIMIFYKCQQALYHKGTKKYETKEN